MMKTISYDEYLQAKGLWSLARDYRKKVDEYGDALNKLLGFEPYSPSHISDSIFEDGDTLEDAMYRERIAVPSREPDQ